MVLLVDTDSASLADPVGGRNPLDYVSDIVIHASVTN